MQQESQARQEGRCRRERKKEEVREGPRRKKKKTFN